MHEYDEWLDSSTVLTFDESGPEFRVEPPSALAMLGIHRRLTEGGEFAEHDERQAIITVLGNTWREMAEAGIAEAYVLHSGRAVLSRYLQSAAAALDFWTFTPPKPRAEPERPKVSIKGIAPDDAVDPPGTINDYDPGGGPYIPELGIRTWANPMEFAPAAQQKTVQRGDDERASWSDIFATWEAIEIDFATIFICDLTPTLLAEQSWRWFAVRLSRILGDPDSLASRMISLRKAVDGGDSAR
ncbi:tail assembly chaperone [Gordonia phage Denise]|uniref:Tail assembly chaperone n=1 Tax=Gordonia phage Denise TaxID=2652879 RepID=A0A5P8DE27_9CAUD|nr:tail assembly chaperone [Gordonia phage Denise]QFP96629.1 tail assembly chaperone [Gordonia phage Denise]